MQKGIRSAGLALDFTWKVFYPTSIADVGATFEQVAAEGYDAVYIWPSPFAIFNRARITAAALQHRLPTISDTRLALALILVLLGMTWFLYLSELRQKMPHTY